MASLYPGAPAAITTITAAERARILAQQRAPNALQSVGSDAAQGYAPITQALAGGQGGGGDQSGGGQSGGGQANPFLTDPGYLAALAAEQRGQQQNDAALRAYQQQAIVQWGDPALAQVAGFNLDPLTAAAAQTNTQAGLSTTAQLSRQRDLNQQSITNALAAHGIIRSGDLGYKTAQNQQNYGTDLYNAQQSLLGQLNQQAQSTLDKNQGLSSGTTSALTSAYNTYVQNPQFWGAADTGGQTAAMNAAAVSPAAAAPVASALAAKPQSRLAVKPAGFGGRATVGQVARNSF